MSCANLGIPDTAPAGWLAPEGSTFRHGDQRLTGDNCVQVPAEVPGVLSVSGVGAEKRKARYSAYGIRDTDVTAPSGDPFQIPDTPDGSPGVITPINSSEWGFFGGTSAATPHVAGVVALIRGTHPNWSADRVLAAVQRDAQPAAVPTRRRLRP
ncbi:S8 family serine peptidase [Actinophytocola sp.]|uniref:S8 family serine peptidase n=1 Tax=Actinophytocola sp. TaxID=1872138 RepID=UPI002ED4854F